MKVKPCGRKGRGVFATKGYRRGTLVMRNEILIVPPGPRTFIDNYVFAMCGKVFLALGQGSLCNHDDKANLWYSFNRKNNTLDFYAARNIKRGEEFTIDYGWDSYPWAKVGKQQSAASRAASPSTRAT